MSHLYHLIGPEYSYFDKKNYSKSDWLKKIDNSTTVYVGNLSFFTTEEIIYETFNSCGPVRAVYMGLNNQTMQPCGFCFVQYYRHIDALAAVTFLNRHFCDGREIRVDWDSGDDVSGIRRYGRGVMGFQWRDELRNQIDPDRKLEQIGMNTNSSKNYRFCHGNNSVYQKRYRGSRGKHVRNININSNHKKLQNRHKYQHSSDISRNDNSEVVDYPDY